MHETIRQPETRLVAEYLAWRYPKGGYRHRVPLGPLLPNLPEGITLEKAIGLSRPWRPEVDAVAWETGRLVLIEAKVFKIVDGLAKLPMYKALVASTPELEEFRGLPVAMRLLCPWESQSCTIMAAAAGIEVELFNPPWIEELVEQWQNYWTREHRLARMHRRQVLEHLGLE